MLTVFSYIFGFLLGILSFPLLFNTPLFDSNGVLFFRGILISVFCFVFQFLILAIFRRIKRAWIPLDIKDIFCICAFSFSFNIVFLIVFPVTFERSVTTYLLAKLEAGAEQGLTQQQMEAVFKQEYVDTKGAINRRMKEQIITGNVIQVGDKFFLTPQGQKFMRTKVAIEKLYGLKTD